MSSVARSVGGAGGVGGAGSAPQGDSEPDEEEELAVLEEGDSDAEIEVGSGDGRTESEEEGLPGRPRKSARTVKEDVEEESGEDARPDLRKARGACLRYLCLYAFLVKVRRVTGDDRKKLCLVRDVAAAVVKWCDSADGEADLGVVGSLSVGEVAQFVEAVKDVWDNSGKKIQGFRKFVKD